MMEIKRLWPCLWLGLLAALTLATPALGQEEFQNLLTQIMDSPSLEEMERLVDLLYQNRLGTDEKVRNSPTDFSRQLPEQGQGQVRRKRSSPFAGCPSVTDQSAPYSLMSSPGAYPSAEIGSELFARSMPGSDMFFFCLVRQVVNSSAGPDLDPQPLLERGTICPQAQSQLWSYTSPNYGNSECWVLAGFQEDIKYNSDCQDCACELPYARYYYYYYGRRGVCYPGYSIISLWSYCASLDLNERIVRDRIIIPSQCSCSKVRCRTRGRRRFFDDDDDD